MNTRLFTRLAIPTLLLVVTVLLSQRPYYNWDMFPYMALAIADSRIPFDSTHREVYRIARAELPPADYAAISSRQPLLMENASAFNEILKYFTIKPAFNAVVSMLHRLGVNLVSATYLPSVFSYFVLGCLLYFWAQRIGPPIASGLFTLVIMLAPPLVDLARYSSPDMLCAMVSFAGFILILYSRPTQGLFVLLLTILIRPDAVILLLLTACALLFSGAIRWHIALIISIIGSMLLMLLLKSPALLEEYLREASPASTLWQSYGDGLGSLLHSYTLPSMGLAALTMYFRKRKGFHDLGSLLLAAVLVSFLIRFLLHPVVEDRFHVPGYLLLLLVLWQTTVENLYPSPTMTNA